MTSPYRPTNHQPPTGEHWPLADGVVSPMTGESQTDPTLPRSGGGGHAASWVQMRPEIANRRYPGVPYQGHNGTGQLWNSPPPATSPSYPDPRSLYANQHQMPAPQGIPMPYPTPVPTKPGASLLAWFAAGSGIVATIAAFLPWFTVWLVSIDGTDVVWGWLTGLGSAVAAICAMACALVNRSSPAPLIAGLAGVLVGATDIFVSGYYFLEIATEKLGDSSTQSDNLWKVDVSAGGGLYLTMLCGLVMTIASLLLLAKSP